MAGVPGALHEPTLRERADGVGDIARIQGGGDAQLGLAQLRGLHQGCHDPVLVARDASLAQAPLQQMVGAGSR